MSYSDLILFLVLPLSFLSIITIGFVIALFLEREKIDKKYKALFNKYKDSLDAEKLLDEINKEINEQKDERKKLNNRNNVLKKNNQLLKDENENIKFENSLQDFGFYEPKFDFETSERFKQEIDQVKKQQKQMIKDKIAVICNTNWEISGSKKEGSKFTNKAIKLTLRAFNNECDTAINATTWKNAENMAKRIEKAFISINDLNKEKDINITDDYLELKMKELYLTFEYKTKKYNEKEEQKEINRKIKEEEKAQREINKQIEDSKKEEEKYERLLKEAQKQAQQKTGEDLEEMERQIAELSASLEQAHQENKRTQSMAQQTKAGYVYVISNIGSFGEDVYKIGMTRRLEPMDRVKELGDASVPFSFDVHALIYTENASDLESALHQKFTNERVNMVNNRKEFFKIPLEKIEEEVLKEFPESEFYKTIEAQEYMETQYLKKQKKEESVKSDATFSQSL